MKERQQNHLNENDKVLHVHAGTASVDICLSQKKKKADHIMTGFQAGSKSPLMDVYILSPVVANQLCWANTAEED